MYLGLAVSLLLHAGLLAWALVTIQTARDLTSPSYEPVAVDFISPSELTKMRAGNRNSKLKEAVAKESPKVEQTPKETPKPKPLVATPPPPANEPPPPKEEAKPEEKKPVEQKTAEPVPPPPKAEPKAQPDKAALEQKIAELAKEAGPTPEELKKIEDDKLAEQKRLEEQRKAEEERKADEQRKAEEQKKAEEHRKAEQKRIAEEKRKAELKRLAEKRKAEEKKRREAEAKAKLDLERLSALIDKSEPKSAPAAAPQPSHPTNAKGPVMGDRDGRDQTISASEAAFLAGLMRQAVSRCWNINAGLDGIDKIIVKVQVRLTRDGRLMGPPRVVNSVASPLFRDAADSAVRALVQCEPYSLPPDKYDGGWEFMELTFDPQRMF